VRILLPRRTAALLSIEAFRGTCVFLNHLNRNRKMTASRELRTAFTFDACPTLQAVTLHSGERHRNVPRSRPWYRGCYHLFETGPTAVPHCMFLMSNGECRTPSRFLTQLCRLSARRATFAAALAFSFFFFQVVNAQTSCGIEHPASGVFICYPNPSEKDADSTIPAVFHLSAQANAAEGQAIAGYTVLLDDRAIYRIALPAPVRNLSIETNLKSPFDSGVHTLQLVVKGAGTREERLQFRRAENASLCDPFGRVFPRACTVLNVSGPLSWSPNESNKPSTNDPVELYSAYSRLYNQNLKSIEADASDVVAIDRQGNLYAVSHSFSGVDFRKYSLKGSILYSSVIPTCPDAFLSIAGVAVDDAGRAWIAGNTNGCLGTTANSSPTELGETGRMRGFVMAVDTTKPSSVPPLYVMYLSDVENRIAAIRIGREGNAYIAGNTTSAKFPHDTSLTVAESPSQNRELNFGFVAALDSSRTALLWSTLLPNTFVTALALDENANLYLTGHFASSRSSSTAKPRSRKTETCDNLGQNCTDVVVAEVSDRGRRLSFAALFGGSGDEEGLAISTAAHGNWIFVTGDTNSIDFPGFAKPNTQATDAVKPFLVAMRPCGTVALYSKLLANDDVNTAPEIAQTSVLDAFAGELDISAVEHISGGNAARVLVRTAPTCSSTIQ
jgi:hypothetical protein